MADFFNYPPGEPVRHPIATMAVATILSITLPVFETGTDPTRLPIGAIVAPVAAALLTILAGIAARVFATPPSPQ